MQPSALRAAWALQNARGFLPSAVQQMLAMMLYSPVSVGTTPSLSSSLKHKLYPTRCDLSTSASDRTEVIGHSLAALARRYASTASVGQVIPAASATGAYAIEIAVQGFEKRYVDMACNTMDDLLMLAFAPKSFAALPIGSPSAADAPVNLAFGAIRRRDVRLPWRRTRFTLLRSPHIDKQGMEQFERREYKTVLTAATNSNEELRRLLEALKIYQFTGVRIRIDVTSAQQVELPDDVKQLLGDLRAGTLQRQVQPASYASNVVGTGIGSSTVTLPAPRSPDVLFQQELSAVLRMLRPLIWSGLQARRRALDTVPEYASWRMKATQQQGQQQVGFPPAPVASAVLVDGVDDSMEASANTTGGGDAYGKLLRQRMRQQMELLKAHPSVSDSPAAAAAAYGLDPAVAAELLARIDADLLSAHEAVLHDALPPSSVSGAPPSSESPSGPERGTSSSPGEAAALGIQPNLDASKMSLTEYVYAVLKYVEYVDALYEAAGVEEERRRSDVALQLAAPGLALRLLQLWSAATSTEFKQHLGLPPAEVEKRILEEQLRREEMARAAAALMKDGASNGGAPSDAASGAGRPARRAMGDAASGISGAGSKRSAAAPDRTGTAQGQGQGQGRGRRPSGQRTWEERAGQDRADRSRGAAQPEQQQAPPRRGSGPR